MWAFNEITEKTSFKTEEEHAKKYSTMARYVVVWTTS